MIAAAEADLGPIAVAVCNAGFYEERRLAEIDDALWDRSLRVLLGGCFHVARATVPGMRARGRGAAVRVSSERSPAPRRSGRRSSPWPRRRGRPARSTRRTAAW